MKVQHDLGYVYDAEDNIEVVQCLRCGKMFWCYKAWPGSMYPLRWWHWRLRRQGNPKRPCRAARDD